MVKLIITLLLLPALCLAQKDYCKNITTTRDEKKLTFTFSSPQLKHLSVIKQFYMTAYFALQVRVQSDHMEDVIPGMLLELEDGTKIENKDATVECTEDPDISTRYIESSLGYFLHTIVEITDSNYKILSTKKIVSIRLNKHTEKISDKEGTQIMNYIQCMKDMKP